MINNYGSDILREMDRIDDLDPTGKYLVAPDPSFVGNLPFDTIRKYSMPLTADEAGGEHAKK